MFTGQENQAITLQEAAQLTAKYRQVLMPLLGGVKGGYIGKEAMLSVLNQEEVVGVRIYLGLTDSVLPLPQFVVVGVNAAGNDITTGVILDRSILCPPNCGIQNLLNS